MIIWGFVIVFINVWNSRVVFVIWNFCNKPMTTHRGGIFFTLFTKEAEEDFSGKGRTSRVRCSQQVQGVLLNPALSAWLTAWKPTENDTKWHSEIQIAAFSSLSSISLLLIFMVYNSTYSCLWMLSGVSMYLWQTMEPATTLAPWGCL